VKPAPVNPVSRAPKNSRFCQMGSWQASCKLRFRNAVPIAVRARPDFVRSFRLYRGSQTGAESNARVFGPARVREYADHWAGLGELERLLRRQQQQRNSAASTRQTEPRRPSALLTGLARFALSR